MMPGGRESRGDIMWHVGMLDQMCVCVRVC